MRFTPDFIKTPKVILHIIIYALILYVNFRVYIQLGWHFLGGHFPQPERTLPLDVFIAIRQYTRHLTAQAILIL